MRALPRDFLPSGVYRPYTKVTKDGQSFFVNFDTPADAGMLPDDRDDMIMFLDDEPCEIKMVRTDKHTTSSYFVNALIKRITEPWDKCEERSAKMMSVLSKRATLPEEKVFEAFYELKAYNWVTSLVTGEETDWRIPTTLHVTEDTAKNSEIGRVVWPLQPPPGSGIAKVKGVLPPCRDDPAATAHVTRIINYIKAAKKEAFMARLKALIIKKEIAYVKAKEAFDRRMRDMRRAHHAALKAIAVGVPWSPEGKRRAAAAEEARRKEEQVRRAAEVERRAAEAAYAAEQKRLAEELRAEQKRLAEELHEAKRAAEARQWRALPQSEEMRVFIEKTKASEERKRLEKEAQARAAATARYQGRRRGREDEDEAGGGGGAQRPRRG